jgi:hypothetical protein
MQASSHDMAIDAVSISHQMSWRCVPRERFGHLLRNPLGRWMRRYGVVNELSPPVCKKHQAVSRWPSEHGADRGRDGIETSFQSGI